MVVVVVVLAPGLNNTVSGNKVKLGEENDVKKNENPVTPPNEPF